MASECTAATAPAQHFAERYANFSRHRAVRALQEQTIVFLGDSTSRRLMLAMCTFLEGEFGRWYHFPFTRYKPFRCPSEEVRAHNISLVYIGGQSLSAFASWTRCTARADAACSARGRPRLSGGFGWTQALRALLPASAVPRHLHIIVQYPTHHEFPVAPGHPLEIFNFLGFPSQGDWSSSTAGRSAAGRGTKQAWDEPRRMRLLTGRNTTVSSSASATALRSRKGERWQEPAFAPNVRANRTARLASELVAEMRDRVEASLHWQQTDTSLALAHRASGYLLSPPITHNATSWNDWALQLGAAASTLFATRRSRRERGDARQLLEWKSIDQAALMRAENTSRRHACMLADGWAGIHTESMYAQTMRVQLVLNRLDLARAPAAAPGTKEHSLASRAGAPPRHGHISRAHKPAAAGQPVYRFADGRVWRPSFVD